MKKPLPKSFMKSIYKILLVLIVTISSQVVAIAQDFHLSQYDAPPLFLNPAMTGLFDGKYRAHLHYRTQWRAITRNAFKTIGASFDMPVKKFALGVQIMNGRAGASDYNALSALLSIGYDMAISSDKNHHVSFGLQGGMIQKSKQNLTFGNQYDPTKGAINPDFESGEVFDNSAFIVHDLNAGLLYFFAKEGARLNPFLGVSAFHITRPKESFYGSNNRIPIRYYVHGGSRVNINEKVQLLPKFIYMRQKNANELNFSLLLNYYLEDSDAFLIFGPTYRSKDAGIIELGIQKSGFTVRTSYDINTSKLKTVSNYRGGFEVSVTYIPQKKKPSYNPIPSCPRI